MRSSDRRTLIELYRCAADACVTLHPDDKTTIPSNKAASHLGTGDRIAALARRVSLVVSDGLEVAPTRDDFIRICLEAAQRLEDGWEPC